MAREEKCTTQLPPIRVPETLEIALNRLAMRSDTALSTYIRRVLERHCFGHAPTVQHDDGPPSEFGA